MKTWGMTLGFAFAASLISSAAVGATSYPLVCRGGGGTLGYNGNIRAALFYFQKASGPAGAGLQPGQCSWVDRRIGQNEPTCLKQTGVDASAWIFPNQMQNSYFAAEPDAPWLRSMKGNVFQTFQVYNPGNGDCFTVTRLGP